MKYLCFAMVMVGLLACGKAQKPAVEYPNPDISEHTPAKVAVCVFGEPPVKSVTVTGLTRTVLTNASIDGGLKMELLAQFRRQVGEGNFDAAYAEFSKGVCIQVVEYRWEKNPRSIYKTEYQNKPCPREAGIQTDEKSIVFTKTESLDRFVGNDLYHYDIVSDDNADDVILAG